MKADIIDHVLSKEEYIDFVFEVEDKFEQIKQKIIENYRTTLVEKLESNQWIVIDNLYFGKSNEYLFFYKKNWKHQFVLYFERDYSNLIIGINTQFQVDTDLQIVAQIQKALARFNSREIDTEYYWIWLVGVSYIKFSWSEIYAGKLFQSTICVIAQMMMMLEDVKL
jgi:hypothetical protein